MSVRKHGTTQPLAFAASSSGAGDWTPTFCTAAQDVEHQDVNGNSNRRKLGDSHTSPGATRQRVLRWCVVSKVEAAAFARLDVRMLAGPPCLVNVASKY